MSVEEAIQHLETYGYCLLEDLIPTEQAKEMAEKYLRFHEDPEMRQYIVGEHPYETLFGVLNYDEMAWSCAMHPDAVAVGRHFVGDGCRVVDACSKPNWPGAPAGGLHVDSAWHFQRVPDVPWLINAIWMLTDFTKENGATGIVPMSHLSRRRSPPEGMTADDPLVKPITGRRGSLLMWHGGAYHTSGANTSDQVRVGLNMGYQARWMNNWIEGGHQPLWPETYERMPPEMQALCVGKRARRREDVYEEL